MHHLGFTRSVSRREYLLHTPDAFVRTPLPGLTGGTAIVHAAPQMGAAFAMTTIEFDPQGTLAAGPAQRFGYVLQGQVTLHIAGSTQSHILNAGGFAYLPVGQAHQITAADHARMVLFEKVLQPLPSGEASPSEISPLGVLIGHEQQIKAQPLNGDDGVQVRNLLPADLAFDFAVNTMTYAPGASLSQVEVHWMEHGLLMLEGGGIYRLAQDWHPVEAGDAIWMAPFCPQWFAGVGKSPAKYLIYKNFNRHVLA
jgi:(S)-ureidoglycine aminohydrolase